MLNRPLIRPPKQKPYKTMNEKEKIKFEINHSDTTCEKILNSKKIKYIILDDLMAELPITGDLPFKFKNITFYIDLHNFIGELFAPNIYKELIVLKRNKQMFISSNIINLIGHLRRYFAKYKIKTKFIFFYSTERAENEINLNPMYKDNFYNTRLIGLNEENNQVIQIINRNISLLETLSDYIPHAYFINSHKINPLMIPYHFIKQNPNELNIIYSNDKMNIMNCMLGENTYILTYNYKQVSLYGKDDLINLYISNKKELTDPISYKLIPFLFTVSGYKKYSISGFPRYGELSAYKYFEKLINLKFISNINYDLDVFINDISKYKKINETHIKTIRDNFELFSLDRMYNRLTISDRVLLDNKITDLQDIKSLVSINDKYYSNISKPIDLESLLYGEKYESLT